MSSNFVDYINTKQFAIKPHSSQPVHWDYQNAKPFHRVTNASDKFLDNLMEHKKLIHVVSQKSLPSPLSLGNLRPLHNHIIKEPLGILSSAVPTFERSWQPKYIEHAYTKNIDGKSQEQIKHDVQLSHARDPVNGGEPRRDGIPIEEQQEWAHRLLGQLGYGDLPTASRKVAQRKASIATSEKFAKRTTATTVTVQPASEVLGISPASSSSKGDKAKNDNGGDATPIKTNNQTTPIKYFNEFTDSEKEIDLLQQTAVKKTKRTKQTTPFPDADEKLTTVFAFKLNKVLEKEIRVLEKKEVSLQATISQRQIDGYSEQVIAKHNNKLKLLQEEIVTKKAILVEKQAERQKQDALEAQKHTQSIPPLDLKLYEGVKLEIKLEDIKVVTKTMINEVNEDLTARGHKEIAKNIKKPDSFLSAVWTSICHSTGIKVISPVKRLAKSTKDDSENLQVEEELVVGKEPD